MKCLPLRKTINKLCMSLSFLSVRSIKIQTQWILILCTYNTGVVIYPFVWLACHMSLECKLFAWVVCVFNTLCGLPKWCFEAIFISQPFGMSSHNPVCVFVSNFSYPADVSSSSYSSESVVWLKIMQMENLTKILTCSFIHLLEINRNTLIVTKFPNLDFIVWYHCHFMKKQG